MTNKKSFCIQLACLVIGLFFATIAFAQDTETQKENWLLGLISKLEKLRDEAVELMVPRIYCCEAAQYTIEGNYFKCDLPDGWGVNRDRLADEVEKVYGLEVVGPRTKEGVPVRITVDYYSRDNTLFESSAEYIKRNTARLIIIKGDRYSPVRTIKVANRDAKTFETEITDYSPPSSPMAVEIAIKNKLVVLPASEGFYVLRYYAPASVYEKYFFLFEKTLKSFTPMR